MKNLKLKMKKGFTPTPVLPSLRFFEKGVSLLRIFSQNSCLAMRSVGAVKQWQNRCRGFTLLETLVAIAILLLAVVGPMSAIGGSLSQIGTARDQMIALNLAQEGIEVVRQKRDSNMLDKWGGGSMVWSDGLTVGDYIIDTTTANPLISCSGCTAVQKLVLQNATGWHYQTLSVNGDIATKFSRVVNITDVPLPAEKMITSTVTWSVGGTTKAVEVKESIFGINSS